MPLSANTKLGPYEVISQIGAGGMGEVYRARDTRLDRKVAIKILPSELSSNSGLKQRFEREAKTISNLSHPHICTLHDVGHENGIDYLVMEYLDGQTLADRLSRGPLSIDEALRYAVQICDALDKAHRQGIVHRDLKPGNIMLTKHGVKLLDFGLAKWTTAESLIEVAATAELTLKQSLTEQGTILGTVQYMAPEQLEGKEADARTDIFAFGAVLYEMVSGTKAFSGKSRASIMAAIIEREPERLSQIAPLIPPALDRVIAGCLAKDPDERWQTAHDLKLQLKWILEGGSEGGVPKPIIARRKRRELAAWCLVGILGISVLGAAVAAWKFASVQPAVSRVEISPPDGLPIESLALSPDGRRMAFVTRELGDTRQLWIRRMDAFDAQVFPKATGATYPFWSPDGTAVGFFADDQLKKMDVITGLVVPLCKAENGRGGSWGTKGQIVFSPSTRGPLHQVQAAGGEPKPVTEMQEFQISHRWPWFLPDGEHFLFWTDTKSEENRPSGGIFVSSLSSSKQPRFLVNSTENGIYADGHLLYVNNGSLMAATFDVAAQQLTGEPFPIAADVDVLRGYKWAYFSAGQSGTLAYRSGLGTRGSQLTWYDLKGAKSGTLGKIENYGSLRLSPDGNWVCSHIYDAASGTSDIWILDTNQDYPMRITAAPQYDSAGVFSPDGKYVVFSSRRKDVPDLYRKEVDSLDPEELIFESNDPKFALSWSPEGDSLLFLNISARKNSDLYILKMDRDPPEAEPFLTQEHIEAAGHFSPDGKWVAYASDEQRAFEVFAISYPEKRGKVPISKSGGTEPVWSPDGTKIYYLDPENFIVQVEVKINNSRLIPGEPRRLFQIEPASLYFRFDIAPDGQRFLVNSALESTNSNSVKLIMNWPLEFQKK